jgi:hypothetical protein
LRAALDYRSFLTVLKRSFVPPLVIGGFVVWRGSGFFLRGIVVSFITRKAP